MSLKEIFQDVYTNWRFGGWPESKSGGGSTMEETEIIRQQIKQIVKDKEKLLDLLKTDKAGKL